MIEGPHIFGFSPVAPCINLTSALASARRVSSVSASINAAALSLVGLVLLSAILLLLPPPPKATPESGKPQLGALQKTGGKPVTKPVNKTSDWRSEERRVGKEC